jgi:chromosome segregation ATPase
MEKISPVKKESIITLYLSGDSYDEIATKENISKGSVANIVGELKSGTFPEAAGISEQIEQLRELSTSLKKSEISPTQCAVGLAVLKQIRECNLDPTDIRRWPIILKEITDEAEAKRFVQLIYDIVEKQDRLGITWDKIDEKLKDMETRASQLAPVISRVEECQKELVDLNKKKHDLVPEVHTLQQQYNLLGPRVKDLEKRESDLSIRIGEQETRISEEETMLEKLNSQKKRLEKIGFSLETLTRFNDLSSRVAVRHKISRSEIKERFFRELESLDRILGLDEMIRRKETELKECQENTILVKKQYTELKATISMLEQHKLVLNSDINTLRDNIKSEMLKIVPVAKDAVNRYSQELHSADVNQINEIKNLKERAIEVGIQIGRYQTLIKENEWLFDFLSLARGEEQLKNDRIKVILLSVLRGAELILKQNQTSAGVLSPLYTTGQLISQLERWKT